MTETSGLEDRWATVESVAAGTLVAAVVVATPFAAGFLHDGALPRLSLAESFVGFVRIVADGLWDDPARAFPARARDVMPNAAGWWAAMTWTSAVVGAFAVGVWRRVDAYVAQSTLGRRSYDLRGSRTRVWARPRDLGEAIARERQPGRFTLGRLDGRLVLSDPESHVALIAPTRSGKTTGFVIPWLLEHDGPAIVTSTKLDVVEATHEARVRRGKVWIWDPFGAGSTAWSPLHGCDDWSYALAQAQWLADASAEGDSEIAAYWRGEAAKLLAPLLHAAALDSRTMGDVLAWVDRQEADEPAGIVKDAGREDARRQLLAIGDLDDRNRGTTYMSAGSLLAAYRYPALDSGVGTAFTPDAFFKGDANTLFLVASARHQRLLAPLIVGMLSSLLHAATERARDEGPFDPTIRCLLDEVANIAPLRDLPAHLSQAAASGVRIVTVWQSLAQMQYRYRAAADGILANSTTKAFMGPITDERTRRYVQGALGEELVETHTRTVDGLLDEGGGSSRTTGETWRSAAGAAELQQLGRGRVLVVDGGRKPVIVRVDPVRCGGSPSALRLRRR